MLGLLYSKKNSIFLSIIGYFIIPVKFIFALLSITKKNKKKQKKKYTYRYIYISFKGPVFNYT